MFIPRNIEPELLWLLKHFPVIAITGSRQVGKTTIAKHLLPEIGKPGLYLDLELDEDYHKLSQPQIFLEQYQDHCVIIDEVQRSPALFPLIRSLVDQNRIPGRFLLLGSAGPDLIQFGSESLAGRIAYKELSPFNFLEIKNHTALQQHWLNGGYPERVLSKDEQYTQIWMKNFIQTYLERDLRMLGLSADPVLIRRFWSMLAHIHGNIWNGNAIGKSLGLSLPTVKRYLNFMENAFLVRQLQPYYANLGKRLIKSPKVYIRDSGVLHYLMGIKNLEQLYGNPLLGHSWEGYVIEQISEMLADDVMPCYYRTHNGAEVDLVLMQGGVPKICIEIKYSVTPKIEKGFHIAIGDLKTEENFVIIPKEDVYPLKENIEVCGLGIFLERLKTKNIQSLS